MIYSIKLTAIKHQGLVTFEHKHAHSLQDNHESKVILVG